MKPILPPDGGPIYVHSEVLATPMMNKPDVLVFVEVDGGPFITLTPHQWSELVRRIRGARTARELGA